MVVVKFPDQQKQIKKKEPCLIRCAYWIAARGGSIATLYLSAIMLFFMVSLFLLAIASNISTFFLIKKARTYLLNVFRGMKRWAVATISFFLCLFYPALGVAMVRFDAAFCSEQNATFSWIIPHMADMVWFRYKQTHLAESHFFQTLP